MTLNDLMKTSEMLPIVEGWTSMLDQAANIVSEVDNRYTTLGHQIEWIKGMEEGLVTFIKEGRPEATDLHSLDLRIKQGGEQRDRLAGQMSAYILLSKERDIILVESEVRETLGKIVETLDSCRSDLQKVSSLLGEK